MVSQNRAMGRLFRRGVWWSAMRALCLASFPLLALASIGCRGGSDAPPKPTFAELSPKVGEAGPAFSLVTLDSDEPIALADLCGTTPAVLIFGSYS